MSKKLWTPKEGEVIVVPRAVVPVETEILTASELPTPEEAEAMRNQPITVEGIPMEGMSSERLQAYLLTAGKVVGGKVIHFSGEE